MNDVKDRDGGGRVGGKDVTPVPADLVQGAQSQLRHFLFSLRLLRRRVMRAVGLSSRQPKLFFIGFNKTGTKSLHKFFRDNGYLSVHHGTHQSLSSGEQVIAKVMDDNHHAGRPLLAGIDHYDVYSDMVHLTDTEIIEANQLFRELHAEYPDAYFIFNDRPVHNWLRSRMAHESGRNGSLLRRFAAAAKVNEADVPDVWRKQYLCHKSNVMDYFAGNPRFRVYDIESDSPVDLVKFLAPSFKLDAVRWSHYGSQAQRQQAASRRD